MTCSMSGDLASLIDFACGTTSACSGMTVTVDGTEHTVGVDLTASIDPENIDSEIALTGTICVDDTEVDFEDIDDAEITSDDLTCE